jgi:hypothetical protein
MNKEDIYLKNVARRWGNEVNDQDGVIILSPYITPST